MKQNNYKPQIPDVMEAIFDAAYLIFDLIAGLLFFFFSQGDPLFILYGILTLTLCGGDAFHLVPRILRVVRGSNDKIKRQLGIGLQVSSITMTVFYIILMYIWKLTFPELAAPVSIEAVVWISAIVRIVIWPVPSEQLVFRGGESEVICHPKRCLCSDRYRDHHPVCYVRKHLWLPYDKNGCGHHHFLWLLSSGNFIQ